MANLAKQRQDAERELEEQKKKIQEANAKAGGFYMRF